MTQLKVLKADITTLAVDAIVNAANTSLLGGGGVDGAIHRAAGPELLAECRTLNGCKTGNAKITKGYNLPAKYVIHTVGPIWKNGYGKEGQQLADCYGNSLWLALQNGIATIAFPNISTGVYRFPKGLAATIAIRCVAAFIELHPTALQEVLFVCFDDENLELYESGLRRYHSK
jgi:O-acetyl-ADP-ribose deacetylase (regulator of RNase III)